MQLGWLFSIKSGMLQGMNEEAQTQTIPRDWRLKATTLAHEIVFEERISQESKQLKCWLDDLSKDITKAFKESSALLERVGDCTELRCAGYRFQVTFNGYGESRFTLENIEFRVHKAVFVKDAVACAETILKLREKADDFAGLENPIVEIGAPMRPHKDMDIAEASSKAGTLSFYQHHETGRLWASAIDELTAKNPTQYRHTTVEHIAEHEFAHLIELNPAVDRLNDPVADVLGQIRTIPTQAERETAVDELLQVSFALNPKYCPMKTVEWLEQSMVRSDARSPKRLTYGRERYDRSLAKELVAEALSTLRWDEQDLRPDLVTPVTNLTTILRDGCAFKPVAVAWSDRGRAPKLISMEDWKPEVRCAQTAPAFEYSSTIALPAEQTQPPPSPGVIAEHSH